MDQKQFIATYQPLFIDYCVDWADHDMEEEEPAREFAEQIVYHVSKNEKTRLLVLAAADKLRQLDKKDPECAAFSQVVPLRQTYFGMNHIPLTAESAELRDTLLKMLLASGVEMWSCNYGLDNTVPWMFTQVSQGEVDPDDLADFGPYAIDCDDGIPEPVIKVLKDLVAQAIIHAIDTDPAVLYRDEYLQEAIALRRLINSGRLAEELDDEFEGGVHALVNCAPTTETKLAADLIDLWHTWFVYLRQV